jgi:hypothetical protein
MKPRHAGLIIAALAVLALCGCGPAPVVADVPQVGDTAELVEGPEHGVMPPMRYVWAVPQPEPEPLRKGNSIVSWWKRIETKILTGNWQ